MYISGQLEKNENEAKIGEYLSSLGLPYSLEAVTSGSTYLI